MVLAMILLLQFVSDISNLRIGVFGDSLTVVSAQDDDFIIDEDGTLTQYTGSASIVTIPDEVTAIGECAFEYHSEIEEIIIPEGVTVIDRWAFCDCSGLTDITIPFGITVIGDSAFSGCSSLISITIP